MSKNLYLSFGRDTTAQKKLVKLAQFNKARMCVGYYNKQLIFDIRDNMFTTFRLEPSASSDSNCAYWYAAMYMLQTLGISSSRYVTVTIGGKEYSIGSSIGGRTALAATARVGVVSGYGSRNFYVLTVPKNVFLDDGQELTAKVVCPAVTTAQAENMSGFFTSSGGDIKLQGNSDIGVGTHPDYIQTATTKRYFPPIPGTLRAKGCNVSIYSMNSRSVLATLNNNTQTAQTTSVTRKKTGDYGFLLSGLAKYTSYAGAYSTYNYAVWYTPSAINVTMKVYVNKVE